MNGDDRLNGCTGDANDGGVENDLMIARLKLAKQGTIDTYLSTRSNFEDKTTFDGGDGEKNGGMRMKFPEAKTTTVARSDGGKKTRKKTTKLEEGVKKRGAKSQTRYYPTIHCKYEAYHIFFVYFFFQAAPKKII